MNSSFYLGAAAGAIAAVIVAAAAWFLALRKVARLGVQSLIAKAVGNRDKRESLREMTGIIYGALMECIDRHPLGRSTLEGTDVSRFSMWHYYHTSPHGDFEEAVMTLSFSEGPVERGKSGSVTYRSIPVLSLRIKNYGSHGIVAQIDHPGPTRVQSNLTELVRHLSDLFRRWKPENSDKEPA